MFIIYIKRYIRNIVNSRRGVEKAPVVATSYKVRRHVNSQNGVNYVCMYVCVYISQVFSYQSYLELILSS